ncbi:hypothetical protein HN51_001251 [Arachis hypogaea]|uniref:uncharacterized protein n=1 Tax=Arachis hypogaea TaxID=3818 RepID=UPI000DEC9697|nr:uncharacterized protein LOC112709917 [Arachis hypogaea]QHO49314.1 uncharacterized protein DS421_1g12940 [Arachis hypogaea]
MMEKPMEVETRESLIAISNFLPDDNNILDYSIAFDHSKKSDEVAIANNNGDTDDANDKYISELISISYFESPDAKVSS